MNIGASSVLFLGKSDDLHVQKAAQYCRMLWRDVKVCLGNWGDPFPEAAETWAGDIIVSYLSRWILPEPQLTKARLAINFHPGPPEYPGYGCNNFALYEGAREYGVTCHYMVRRVDAGPVIATRRFAVHPADNAATLLARAYDHQLVLFYEIMDCLARDEPLPRSEERWTRAPFTRNDLAALRKISPDMDRAEVARRVRATVIGAYRPEITLHGFTFDLRNSQDS